VSVWPSRSIPGTPLQTRPDARRLPVRVSLPYYLCASCGVGQFPVDAELHIENTEFSPGVRRMHALAGREAPCEHGRERMKVLAGLEVTTLFAVWRHRDNNRLRRLRHRPEQIREQSHASSDKFVPALICPGDAVYRFGSSKVLSDVMRDYQPIWRIRSRMSPL
jgi:hypothetical protein